MRLPLVYGVLGCSWNSASWRMCRYAVCPACHHARSWERIQEYFSPTHWGKCLLKICIFYSLDRRSGYVFAHTWKRTSWRVYWYAGCPWGRHGCSWATMRVYFACEKNVLTMNTYTTSNRFFLFLHTPTHACARNSRTTLCFKTCKSFYQTNSHVGIPNLASYRSKSNFGTLFTPFQSEPRI
jgi:hypothetical protein